MCNSRPWIHENAHFSSVEEQFGVNNLTSAALQTLAAIKQGFGTFVVIT